MKRFNEFTEEELMEQDMESIVNEERIGRVLKKGVYLSIVSRLFNKLKKSKEDQEKLDTIGEILKTMVQYQVFGTK